MEENDIRELQISALSRINFCFYQLKRNPPVQWINSIINNKSLGKTKENYSGLNAIQKEVFSKDLFMYLDRESTTEARIMLVINYLTSLLIEGKNNNISIHKNFNSEKICKFTEENKDLLNRLKNARDKLYAHIDLDWANYAKGITFGEFQKCINFLNDLFNYSVFDTNQKYV